MSLNATVYPQSRFEHSHLASLIPGELKENHELSLAEDIGSRSDFAGIVGQSAPLRQVLKLVDLVAACDATVLLLGETGTGKELIARAIHERSARRKETFVTLNCAAIPSSLFESELFGHERGAFTGAHTHTMGRLEAANKGTMFLDEVGDLPLELQPKLLRALQERAYERVGSARTRNVDVRLVAATNCDLEQMMAEKQFRSDLYYRLNVFPIRIPPLRERREDIPLLVHHFTRKYACLMGKSIKAVPATAMKRLMCWRWPGNVRELENLIERSVILSNENVLTVSLPEKINRALNVAKVVSNFEEQERIVRILRETKGRISGPNGAALRLGVKRSTLLDRMKKFGIDAREARNNQEYSRA
jgi:formate hydrogenlyase transcriptional activator